MIHDITLEPMSFTPGATPVAAWSPFATPAMVPETCEPCMLSSYALVFLSTA